VRHRRAVIVSLVAAAAALAGCHAPARLGVDTTVVPVAGTCDTSAVVLVGASLPLSGPLSALGRAELTGLQVGVTRVNNAGGVLSAHRCLELMYKDDRSQGDVDGQALLDLAHRERVSLVVGPLVALNDPTAGAQLGALGVTAASFSSASGTFVPQRYPYTFPVGSSAAAQAKVLVTYVGRAQWRRITALSAGGATANQAAGAFIAAARTAGFVVTAAARSVGTRPGAAAALDSVRATRPDAVVVFGDGGSLAPLLSVRHALHLSVPLVLAGQVPAPGVARADLEGVAVVEPRALSVRGAVPPGLASFRTAVVRALHRRTLDGPLTPYAQAADSIEMFANAANGVNADDPGSLRTYLENANYQGLLGSYNFTSGAHTGLDASQLTVVPFGSLTDGFFVTKRAPPFG
jgi:ABC-type branched-subunit amino acid transport system substrate-binding protein